jgi:nitroreductase
MIILGSANLDSNINSQLGDFAKALIHSRQHISPKRLESPGPSAIQIKQILDAAGAAPDHGQRTPWHFYEIQQNSRAPLGNMFATALLERDINATNKQVEEAKQKAFRGPLLFLVTAKLNTPDEIPDHEKLISIGCAIQNVLLTANSLGYGSGLSSGKAFTSKAMREFFFLAENEKPLCFITIGTISKHKPNQKRPTSESYSSLI